MRILLIEDDTALAATINLALKPLYAFDMAHTAQKGLELAQYNDYDCILLDLTLPDADGLDVCHKLRGQGYKSPVLMLTARSNIDDRVRGLDSGADDYLTKPFSLVELQARIRALLRRTPDTLANNTLTVGNVSLDLNTREVKRDGQSVPLRRKEFDLLEYLLRNQGRVLTRSMILEHVWDNSIDPFTNAIDVHIKYLRDRIDRPYDHQLIKTVHGLGYKFEIPQEDIQEGGEHNGKDSVAHSDGRQGPQQP